MSDMLNLTLKVWRQAGPDQRGDFKTYPLNGISTHMSFLEMLDVLNEQLIERGEEPIAFDHDCREGICGACGLMINGQAHGPDPETTTCQLHMRLFKNGDMIVIEPWRATASCWSISTPRSKGIESNPEEKQIRAPLALAASWCCSIFSAIHAGSPHRSA